LRELETLEAEIAAYPSDADLWKLSPGITNSGGTLALHLCGNLQHFLGACLGSSGYVRDRAAEFSQRGLSRDALVQRIRSTHAVVQRVFQNIDAEQLQRDFPEAVGGVTLNTAAFLAHLASHLAFHLGQIDFHRRLSTGAPPIAGAVAVSALAPKKD
jgi:hypothetical protein